MLTTSIYVLGMGRAADGDMKSEERLKNERKGKLEMWAERRKEKKQKKQKDKVGLSHRL